MSQLRRTWRAILRLGRRTADRVDRHPFLTVIVAVAVVTVPGYRELNQTDQELEAAIERIDELVERFAAQQAAFELERCESRRDFAVVLRGVVERSDDPTDFQFSTLDGFDELDDPTRRLLLDLERRAALAPEPSRFVLDALELIGPIPVCDEERAGG